jgi:type III secretion system FlhB-like substrate exporter
MSVPTRKVVGLAYTPGEGLPQVMLKGVGAIAEELLARGVRSGTPVVRDRDLVERLFRLPMDRIVAVVLAHVLALNRHRKETSDA